MCALLVALAGGCVTVGPDYVEPEPEAVVPDSWSNAAAREVEGATSPLVEWWTVFDDPKIGELIERARASNLDLMAAVSRIVEARAIRGIATAGRIPDLDVDAGYAAGELSENTGIGSIPGVADGINEEWNVGVGISWEIDVFGRIRRQIEAANAQYEATVENYRDVLVLLFADVGANYVEIRSLQARLAFAHANVQAQRESLQLTRDRFAAGLTSALDVSEAESNLGTSESEIPLLETALNAALNRLAVLLGEPPGSLHDELSEPEPIPSYDGEIALGVPADLLRRRPDIRRSERQLAAQNALIGVATADLYPTFSLGGFLGLQAADFGDLADSGSANWTLVPGLRWRIFDGGRIRNNIRAEEARTEQAYLAYEKSVLFALQEVEDALVAYQREGVRREILSRAAQASERSVELVRTQYLAGLAPFQRLLDSQRSLSRQQDSLAASQGQVVQNLIALNLALGGGWDPATSEADPVVGGSTGGSED